MSAGLTRLKAMLPRSSFARNVAVLAGGTAAGQAIVVLASPVLTRLYTPEDFGVLAVYSSLLGILSTVAALRYELAIPLPEKDEDAAALVVLSLSIVVGMSLLVGAGVWLLGERIVKWTNAQALKPYLWLLPVGVGFVGAYQVFYYQALRRRAFKAIASTKLSQGIAQTCMNIGMGFLRLGIPGLLIGNIVGQAAGLTTLASLAFKKQNIFSHKTGNSNLVRIALRYRRFPLISSVPAIINATGLQIPVLLLSGLYGSQVAGWFALATRVMGIPLSLLAGSAGQVFFAEAGKAIRNRQDIKAMFWNTIKQQVYMALVIALFMPLLPWIFNITFGSNWREAGVYAALFSLALLLQFVTSPIGGALDVLERQDLHFIREVFRILCLCGAILVSYYTSLQPRETIFILSLAASIASSFYFFSSWLAIRKHELGDKK